MATLPRQKPRQDELGYPLKGTRASDPFRYALRLLSWQASKRLTAKSGGPLALVFGKTVRSRRPSLFSSMSALRISADL